MFLVERDLKEENCLLKINIFCASKVSSFHNDVPYENLKNLENRRTASYSSWP